MSPPSESQSRALTVTGGTREGPQTPDLPSQATRERYSVSLGLFAIQRHLITFIMMDSQSEMDYLRRKTRQIAHAFAISVLYELLVNDSNGVS